MYIKQTLFQYKILHNYMNILLDRKYNLLYTVFIMFLCSDLHLLISDKCIKTCLFSSPESKAQVSCSYHVPSVVSP